MKNTKYKHGYWPKISYWQAHLNDAVWNMDLKAANTAHYKLNYFIGKQWELEYGHNIAGVDFGETLSKFPTL